MMRTIYAKSNLDELVDIPVRPKANTITEYILALMYSPWGENGRSSRELLDLANAHGIYLPPSTLSGILCFLLKKSKLVRDKEILDQYYTYYPFRVK